VQKLSDTFSVIVTKSATLADRTCCTACTLQE